MPRRTKLNESGYQIGSTVRVERGLPIDDSGNAVMGGDPVWIVSKKVDVTEDPDTTYSYRFEEAGRFAETELGECPQAAFDKADALAQED